MEKKDTIICLHGNQYSAQGTKMGYLYKAMRAEFLVENQELLIEGWGTVRYLGPNIQFKLKHLRERVTMMHSGTLLEEMSHTLLKTKLNHLSLASMAAQSQRTKT